MLSKPMLTVHEVADLLKVKEATVRVWINDRSLRAVKFGREWRVAMKDLEAFVEARANRGVGEDPKDAVAARGRVGEADTRDAADDAPPAPAPHARNGRMNGASSPPADGSDD